MGHRVAHVFGTACSSVFEGYETSCLAQSCTQSAYYNPGAVYGVFVVLGKSWDPHCTAGDISRYVRKNALVPVRHIRGVEREQYRISETISTPLRR